MSVAETVAHCRQPRPLASEPPRREFDAPHLSAKAAADYLGITVRALYNRINRGSSIPVLRADRTLRFKKEHLDRWLAGERRVALLSEARARR